MRTNTRIQADAFNDLLGIESFAFCVGIQLIEVCHTQRQIGIGKQLYSFCFSGSHEERIDVLLDGTFLEQSSKSTGCLHGIRILLIHTDNDAAGIEIIIQRFGFP